MPSPLDLSRAISFGASVAGPRHRYLAQPNQDAWVRLSGLGYRGLAVADGMGSASRARLGARLACRAVQQVAAGREGTGITGEEISAAWQRLVAAEGVRPRDARTTCLFAIVTANGQATIGQIGDGIVLLATSESTTTTHPHRPGFANQTLALGGTTRGGPDPWSVDQALFPPDGILLLATDGVADDLVPGSEAGFAQHVVDVYRPLPPHTRWQRLAADLREWPVPHHLDDKTVASLSILP